MRQTAGFGPPFLLVLRQVVLGALLSTLVLAVLVRHNRTELHFTLAAFLCIAASLAVFFLFTFPANQATANWTTLPENWQELRRQWEYPHATGALLYFLGLTSLTIAAVSNR